MSDVLSDLTVPHCTAFTQLLVGANDLSECNGIYLLAASSQNYLNSNIEITDHKPVNRIHVYNSMKRLLESVYAKYSEKEDK